MFFSLFLLAIIGLMLCAFVLLILLFFAMVHDVGREMTPVSKIAGW